MNRKQKYEERLLQEQHRKVIRFGVVPMVVIFGSILVFYILAPLLGRITGIYLLSYVFGSLLLYCNILLLNHNHRVNKEKRHMAEPRYVIFIICTLAIIIGVLSAFALARYEGTQGYYSRELQSGFRTTRNMSLYGAMLIMPVPVFLACMVVPYLRRQIQRNLDFLIIGAYSIMGFVKFGCHADGCCYGIQIDQVLFGRGMFPVQLVEALCLYITLAFLMWYQMKCKRRIVGASYPIGLLLYCPVRFIWEFFRDQVGFIRIYVFNGLMTFGQFLSIIGFVAGAVWLGILLWRRTSARKLPAMAQ